MMNNTLDFNNKLDPGKKTVAVLTSGGDAPGMNACVRAVTRKAIAEGYNVVGVLGGYAGLVNDDMVVLSTHDVSNIVTRGGTIIYTSRCLEFETEAGMQKALANCEKYNICAVIAIGGDGTFAGATDLTNHGIPSIGIPGTIDNDIAATDYTIGFDTAINSTIRMIDQLRDTCESHSRLSVVEVMGRECGRIALLSGIASGAVCIAIPEVPFDEERAMQKLETVRKTGKRGMIAVISEGVVDENKKKYSELFVTAIKERNVIETRSARCGHIVRGGSPTQRDRIAATVMGVSAVDLLIAGKSNVVVCEQGGVIVPVDINYARTMDAMSKKKLKPGELERYTDEQIAAMKATCETRKKYIQNLYRISEDVCKY